MDRFEVVKVGDKFGIWDNKANDLYEYSSKYDTEKEAFEMSETLNNGTYGEWNKFN